MASGATGFAPVSIDHPTFPIFCSELGTPVSAVKPTQHPNALLRGSKDSMGRGSRRVKQAVERHVAGHGVHERKLHWAIRLEMRAARRLFPVLTKTVWPIHHLEIRGAGTAKMALQASAVFGYRHGMSCASVRFSPAIEDWLFPALLEMPVVQRMLRRPTARRRDDKIGLGEQFGVNLQESAHAI